MDIQEKRLFLKHIKRLDPKEEYVKIDLERNEILYSNKIKQHRKITELTKEEIVRAYVVVKLITQLKYSPDLIELEKEHIIGRRTKRVGARIDVLVKKNDKTYSTFMIIEVKAPDEYDREMEEIKTQLFQVAKLEKGTQYLIYYTAYILGEELKERVVSISYSRFESYTEWENEGKPNLMNIPKEYGLIKKPVFSKGGIPDLRNDVNKDELERIRKDLHNYLWGGGRYHGNEIFTFIMKLFLAKIFDEKETEQGKAYDFQIFYENGSSESAEKTYQRVNELYKKALQRYLNYKPDDAKDKDVRKIGEKTIEVKKVKHVVESFQDISLTKNIHDILGNFFERFLWSEFKQSKGQFFTHPNIVNFIIQSLELDKMTVDKINEESTLPFIIDPACGSGTFLIESMKTLTDFVIINKNKLKETQSVKELLAREFPENKKYAWAEKFIYGLDYNEDLSLATKVNMVMHGDGSVNIESVDALSDFSKFNGNKLNSKKFNGVYTKPVNELFDVIISNPPFSIKLEKETKGELPNLFIYAEKGGSENLFIERWYQLLKPLGRLGVVLPESVFDTEENKYVRLFLYKYFWIKAVISLPVLTFQPYTSTKTCLLFAQKKDEEDVIEYEKLWEKYKEEYRKISKDITDIFKRKELQIGETEEEMKVRLIKLLKAFIFDEFDEKDSSLSLQEIKNKYESFTQKKDLFFVDEDWWVFRKISEELDYKIFMAEVENIGYKRTTRWEKTEKDGIPNELFNVISEDGKRKFIIDKDSPKNALDYMRCNLRWQ
jgi:type I restriction enzyme M protein